MIIGPKYKIARRLGAPIFEKTQTQKYAFHLERKGKKIGFSRPKSEFGIQMNEKQKARFTYGLTERQFSNYVKEAISKKRPNTSEVIFQFLERRLDNIVYRLGFAATRSGSRQIVSHGHINVNDKRVNRPSFRVSLGDKIAIRPGSLSKVLFAKIDERLKNINIPAWIKLDQTKKTSEIQNMPVFEPKENTFDLNAVIEFYSR
ncbi:MAG: 30S ribosomal protein S4 [Candidatus Zambryskibacteria bacterium]|nr:30S ribosomal protein S4 [Candidatus Zambryskibacteria bacterium]